MAGDTEGKRRDYTGCIVFAILMLVMIFFDCIGKEDLEKSVSFPLAMIICAIRIRWDLRRRFWFWGIITFLFFLHVPLFARVELPKGKLALLPIGLLDLLIILGAVHFVKKFIIKSSTQESRSPGETGPPS